MAFTSLWACKRAMEHYHGAYPENFLERVYSMLGVSKGWKICHLFSGTIEPKENEVCVDIMRNGIDATETKFKDNTFDLVLSDPPYDVSHAKVYGTKYPKIKHIMQESFRITKVMGFFGLLHFLIPINPYPKKCERVAVIGITEGANMRIRAFNLFRKLE